MKTIAETAFNHNGDPEYLWSLISEANNSKADYVTVQVMDTDSFCVKDYERYQTYIDTEIAWKNWVHIFDKCKEANIKVIPCILEETSLQRCYEYGFRFFKIHATDITNKCFLEKIALYDDCVVILETQCATNFDIRFALDILKDKVVCLMHGFSDYPTEFENLNLNALDHLKEEFNIPTGFADHSLDTLGIPVMCLSKGCEFIEKHITLTRNNRNFDWQVSLYPNQFLSMVSNIVHYKNAMQGTGVKHPTKRELSYRSVLYKKVIDNSTNMLRADSGIDYIGSSFEKFKKNNTGVAVIARLKSQRLKEKVLKPFHTNSMIVDLCNRVSLSGFPIFLATSNLKEDKPLLELCKNNKIKTYAGHPQSVLDRMLWLAFKNEWGGIFRVTGDNPFTDPDLMKEMSKMLVEEDLDYVRVNGAPFGTTAELFSTGYLWNLYLEMKNPMNSEYLSWFVLNDKNAKSGAINLSLNNDDLKFVNLSVDYKEDLDRCLSILNKLNKRDFNEIAFNEIINTIDTGDIVNKNKIVKLPEGKSITLSKYVEIIEDKHKYMISKKLK